MTTAQLLEEESPDARGPLKFPVQSKSEKHHKSHYVVVFNYFPRTK
jgi:hypothetical protein